MACFTNSPRIVGTNRVDFYSLDSILASPPLAGKSGEELILAIYNYFTSTVDGSYHFWPMDEIAGNPRIRRVVHDPLPMLNAYGWMICGQCSAMLYGLYRAAGFQARQIGVPGHALCEVYYEGRWHILDVDMWTWFRTPEGHIAGAGELAKNASALILENKNRSDPCNLPDRSLEDYTRMYATCETVGERVKGVLPHWHMAAHTMDFRLRPGETLVRSQRNEGRFHMPQEWKVNLLKRYVKEWHGSPIERYAPLRTFGNGRWTYEPNLSAEYADFNDGVWESDGVTQDPDGLSGPGRATFRVCSPYPFCGKPDWSKEAVTYADGVWLESSATGAVKVEVTDAEGKWVALPAESKRHDITPLLSSRYDCLIRFTLPAGARLKHFTFDGYIMTAPMSLPRLIPGDNKMEVRALDKHHLCTTPWNELIDFHDSADLPQQAEYITNGKAEKYIPGWQTLAPKNPGQPVQAVFKFAAPAGRQFAWSYALMAVREGPENEPRKRASIEWSRDGESWTVATGLDIPNTHFQWDSSLECELQHLPSTPAVWYRITSQTAICAVEFYGHLDDGPPRPDIVQITHRWREGSQEKSLSAPLNASTYSVICGDTPVDHTIEMHVPSRRK
jgi:hypothetical protein